LVLHINLVVSVGKNAFELPSLGCVVENLPSLPYIYERV